jgi:hypothetical protein
VRLDFVVYEALFKEGDEVLGFDVEAELLQSACEVGFVEEGVGGMRETFFEHVLVDEYVELVGLDYDGHIK